MTPCMTYTESAEMPSLHNKHQQCRDDTLGTGHYLWCGGVGNFLPIFMCEHMTPPPSDETNKRPPHRFSKRTYDPPILSFATFPNMRPPHYDSQNYSPCMIISIILCYLSIPFQTRSTNKPYIQSR